MTFEQIKGLVADLARPFSIVATSLSAAVVPVIVVWRIAPDRLDLVAAAALVGALYAGVIGLYWGKATENIRIAGHNAEVEKERARAAAPSPPAEALKLPATPEVDGELAPQDKIG